MAGVKVTDLPSLGTAAPDDILYIVDTNTDQSKKIEVQNLVGGLPDIESGPWNPTPTAVSPSNPSVLIISGNYSRVGDVVTCSLFMDVTMGSGEVIATFDLDLPIPSDFNQSKNAFGIIAFTGDTGSISSELINWGISADVATNKIVINMQSTSADFNYQYVIAMLQYVII